MIKVAPPPAPQDFDDKVRNPGMIFLAEHPDPTNALWRTHRYWKHAHQQLYDSLGGICSYCSSFTPRKRDDSGLDHTSIDHFIPKSREKNLAYEWSNYRLCRTRLNNRKGDFNDVIDPYLVDNGLFRFNFGNFFIVPDAGLSEGEKERVAASIQRLGLNEDESYVNERARVIYAYVDGSMSFDMVTRFYPFIALEIATQDFDKNHMPIFKRALSNNNVRQALIQQGILQEVQ